jgi:hypothetical protein
VFVLSPALQALRRSGQSLCCLWELVSVTHLVGFLSCDLDTSRLRSDMSVTVQASVCSGGEACICMADNLRTHSLTHSCLQYAGET